MQRSSQLFIALTASIVPACSSEVPRPPSADEVCWDVENGGPQGFCANQRVCLPKETDFSATETSSGLKCATPGECIPSESGIFYYGYGAPGLTLTVAFNAQVRPDMTVEQLASHLWEDYTSVTWSIKPTEVPPSSHQDMSANAPASVQFISYDPPLLRLHVEAESGSTSLAQDTPPYSCANLGGFPSICSGVFCGYEAAAGENTRLVADLELTIETPQ